MNSQDSSPGSYRYCYSRFTNEETEARLAGGSLPWPPPRESECGLGGGSTRSFTDCRENAGLPPTRANVVLFRKKEIFFCLFHGSIKNDSLGLAGCSTTLCGSSQVSVLGAVLVLPVKEPGTDRYKELEGQAEEGGRGGGARPFGPGIPPPPVHRQGSRVPSLTPLRCARTARRGTACLKCWPGGDAPSGTPACGRLLSPVPVDAQWASGGIGQGGPRGGGRTRSS